MQEIPLHRDIEHDYEIGYQRVMRYAEYARRQGWQLTDRQLVLEILHHERAALISREEFTSHCRLRKPFRRLESRAGRCVALPPTRAAQ